jgi:23S rRNA (guanosine2251-2'-O)-methyltransferase
MRGGERPWERDRRPGPRQPFRQPSPPLSPDLFGEDEELIAGRRPVEEAFVAGRAAHRLLVVPQRRHALEQLVLHATRLRIPIVEVEGGTLTAVAGFDGHQGIALIVGPRRFASLDDLFARALEQGEPPFVLVLDSLEDPQNLGTLLRSAEAAGVHGVIFPTRRQAPLSPSAIKASAGAVEHLLLCPVDDLPGALADLHGRGLRIAGAEAEAPMTARQTDLRGPLALVVGSEGQGLGPAIRRRCDTFMRIPMRGAVGSLNAAVAGSILLFEAVAQRDPEGAGAPPRPVPGGDAAEDDAAEDDAAEPQVEVMTEPEAATVDTDTAQPEPGATEPEHETTETESESPTPEPGTAEPAIASTTEPDVAATTETVAPEPAAPGQPGSAPVKATKPRARKARAATSGSPRPRSAKSDAVAEADELLPGGPPVQPPDHSDPEGS